MIGFTGHRALTTYRTGYLRPSSALNRCHSSFPSSPPTIRSIRRGWSLGLTAFFLVFLLKPHAPFLRYVFGLYAAVATCRAYGSFVAGCAAGLGAGRNNFYVFKRSQTIPQLPRRRCGCAPGPILWRAFSQPIAVAAILAPNTTPQRTTQRNEQKMGELGSLGLRRPLGAGHVFETWRPSPRAHLTIPQYSVCFSHFECPSSYDRLCQVKPVN